MRQLAAGYSYVGSGHMFDRVRFLVLLGVAAIALPALCARGQEVDVPSAVAEPAVAGQEKPRGIPPPLKSYMGRQIAQTMHYAGAPWLTRESRQREEDCEKLLAALNVKPGQTICDMGCGNGFYTLKLAEMVGEDGVILAVDIQQEMLRLLDVRAKDAGITNIELIHGSVVDPRLPEGEVDMILCVDVYHEFSHPEHMLRAMRAALKPDGRLVLAEFRLEDPNVPIKLLHKMSKKQILKELEPNGFKLVEEYDDLPWQHLMFVERGPLAKPEDE